MMWDRVFLAVEEALLADAELAALLGTDSNGLVPIYRAQASRKVGIPSIEIYGPVVDREEEIFNPITVQIDYWARGAPRVGAAIERRIRQVLHRDRSRVLGGLWMWTMYEDSRSHDYAAEGGVTHRSLDFLFRPLREKYEELHATS